MKYNHLLNLYESLNRKELIIELDCNIIYIDKY